jgi:hypothetical protein
MRVPSTTIPAIRVVRKEERSMKRLASPASTDRYAAHLYDRRLFSAEDANPSWTFSVLVEPSPNTVDL